MKTEEVMRYAAFYEKHPKARGLTEAEFQAYLDRHGLAHPLDSPKPPRKYPPKSSRSEAYPF